jgi:RHS repeat-associated protein
VVDVATGSVIQAIEYDAFGRVTSDSNPGWQPFGFAGGMYESATGLVRFGARDYLAEAGRWTAKDPIGFAAGQGGLYSYVAGDPINNYDPNGLLVIPLPLPLPPPWVIPGVVLVCGVLVIMATAEWVRNHDTTLTAPPPAAPKPEECPNTDFELGPPNYCIYTCKSDGHSFKVPHEIHTQVPCAPELPRQ